MWIDNNKLYTFRTWKLLFHINEKNAIKNNYNDFCFSGNSYKYIMNYYYKYSATINNKKDYKRAYIICG